MSQMNRIKNSQNFPKDSYCCCTADFIKYFIKQGGLQSAIVLL